LNNLSVYMFNGGYCAGPKDWAPLMAKEERR